MRRVTFEPRGDGRAQPVEHPDMVIPTPRGGRHLFVRLRRDRPMARTLRALAVLAVAAATSGATVAAIELVPPLLSFVVIGSAAAIVLLGERLATARRQLREAGQVNLLLREELELCRAQREEGRRRIRDLTLRLNGVQAASL